MIDIHNHIIYDCDDGAKSIEQSVRMIKAAKDAGITEICFTPHYMDDGYKSNREELTLKVEEIKKCLIDDNIDIKLYLGEEVFIFPDLPASLDKIICLNDSKYILFEIPLFEEINFIDDVVYKLFTLGKIPILAHPERYMLTQKNYSYIKSLVNKGVLLQMNINSLIGYYGKEAKKLSKKLLDDNLIHFVASDAHSSTSYANIQESLAILRNIVDNKKFIEITEENQRKVLLDEQIEIELPGENVHNKRHSLFSLFRKKD